MKSVYGEAKIEHADAFQVEAGGFDRQLQLLRGEGIDVARSPAASAGVGNIERFKTRSLAHGV